MKISFVAIFLLLLSTLVLAQEQPKLETVIQKGHLKYVSCSDFSPNGKYLATGSLDNTIKLWNVSTGKEIRSFNQHTEKIYSVKFSPDGTKLLSSAADNTAIIYDVLSGKAEKVLTTEDDQLRKAVFSPDGSKILTQDNRAQTLVWDSKTGGLLAEYKKDYAGDINSRWFSPDGNQLISSNNYKEAKVMSLMATTDSLVLPFDKAHSFSYSKDGKYIAIGSAKLFTEIFDAKTGKLLYHLKADEKNICDGCNMKAVFSNNSKFLATISRKEDMSLWQVNGGKLLRRFADTKDRADHMTFSPNDQYLMLVNDKEVAVYDVKTAKQVFKVKSNYLDYYEAEFAPNSKYIIIPEEKNSCNMWDVSTGRKVRTFQGFLNQKRTDGLSYTYTNWTHSSILKYLSMKNNIALSPDGKYFVRGKVDSVAMLIDVETGRLVKTFYGHNKVVYAFDFSPDGKTLLSAGGDRYIKLWNVETGEEIRTIGNHSELIFDAKFSSDGKRILSGSWDGSMRIWDVGSGEQLKYIKLTKNSPFVVGFTPDDLYAVSGDLEKSVKFWEADAGEEFRRLVGHTNIIASFDFGPEGQNMASGSWDGKVKLWDVRSGMLTAKYSHTAAVNTVCYDPKGRFIASGGSDRLIQLYDIKKGAVTQTLEGHMNAISSLHVTPDGKRLLSCGIDGVVKAWDLSTYKEIYTHIQIGRNDWLVKIPQGHFDGSSKALQYINYVSGMDAVPVGSLFKKYHTPGLLKRIKEGETFGAAENIHQMIQSSPELAVSMVDVGDIPIDSILEVKADVLKIKVDVESNGVALEEVRIYNNGKLVLYEPADGSKKFTQFFDVELINGRNKISAVVLNQNMAESDPDVVEVLHYGKDALSDLYILSIGINDYKNPTYKLNYALNDAKSYSKIIKKGSITLFDNVVEYFISNEKASKEEVLSTITEISEKAGPEDVFLFYYAGHGVLSKDDKEKEDFYIVSYDVTNIYAHPEELKNKAISATELMQYSMKISAEKQLFVLDACHSGGALNTFASRGVGREKAISQLARSTGTVFLTASQDAQYANEESKLQHGLFTYAIIEALEGKADSGNKDDKVTVNELKTYVEDRVPELSELYGVPAQYPTGYSFGQDFPVVIVK